MSNCWNYNCFYFSLMEVALKSIGGKSNLKESSIRKYAIMHSEHFLNDGKIQDIWRKASVTIFSIRRVDIVCLCWGLLWPWRQSRNIFIFIFWIGIRAQYHWWRNHMGIEIWNLSSYCNTAPENNNRRIKAV